MTGWACACSGNRSAAWRCPRGAEIVGAEVRSLRHYEGLGLNSFAGQALYIGPTLYATFGHGYFLSVAWNVQVWGAVAACSGALELVNFEGHQVKLRLGGSVWTASSTAHS